MGNKRNTAVRVCEIVDGVLSAIWGVFCFVAIVLYGGMPILPEYGMIMTIVFVLLFCMGCYNLIVDIYIAAKGCTVHGVAIAKIVISIIMFALTLLNLQALTFCFYLFWALFDFIMLYAVPLSQGEWDKASESSGQESSVVVAPAPISESSLAAPAQTGIQKYIKCPICHEEFIKESEKCCDRCRLEYERIEAASVLRVVSAKGVYNGKEGYKLMDGKWQNVGIAALDNPNERAVEFDFFDSYKNTYERFCKKIILNSSEDQSAFERKVNYYGSVRIDLISDPSYTTKPLAHIAQTVHSDAATTNVQEDYKKRSTAVVTDKIDPESWRSSMLGLGDEGMKQEYRKFLEKQCLAHNTIDNYVSSINKVVRWESTDWEGVYRDIDLLYLSYGPHGDKEDLGREKHGSIFCAIKKVKDHRDLKRKL